MKGQGNRLRKPEDLLRDRGERMRGPSIQHNVCVSLWQNLCCQILGTNINVIYISFKKIKIKKDEHGHISKKIKCRMTRIQHLGKNQSTTIYSVL